MDEIERKPAIRFAGFTEAWEQCKYKDIFDYERPDKYIVKSDKYEAGNITPVLTANKGFILGYTNETRTYNNPCIIFDDFTLDSKYVNFKFMVKSSAMKILTAKKDNNLYFAFNRLNSSKLESLGHARHYISVVQESDTLIPNFEEQDKLSELFKKIEDLITLHQRKFEALSNIKKALLEKMFPSNGEVTPKIRFIGFTEAWEQRKLGDESIEIIAGGDIERTKLVENGKYPIYANALTNDGLIGYYDHFYRVKAPAVTVTGRGEIGHATARNVDFTPIVRLLSVKSNHFNKFLECSINNHKVISESTGVPQLTVPQLSNYILSFPNDISEEIKIGITFDKIDTLITLHQRKCEKLKNIKKALLEKMFV